MPARILIVDDHPLTREALASLLGAHGLDVIGCASDGAEAIAEAGRLQPDLVLLDLSMPGLDRLPAPPPLREAAPEVEVLLLLDDHLGTDEIAKRLYISEHTVRSHVKSLLRKLGVSSRREALEQLAVARAA